MGDRDARQARRGESGPAQEEGPDPIVWEPEARSRVQKAPAFVRPGILKVTEKRARERGYRVITSEFLTEIRNESMLRVAKVIKAFGFEELTMEAFDVAKEKMKRHAHKLHVIGQIEAYLADRTEKNHFIVEKFRQYLERIPERGLPWTEEALQRLEGMPEFVRKLVAPAVAEEAKKRKEKVVTREVVEAALRQLAQEPPAEVAAFLPAMAQRGARAQSETSLPWSREARERLERIPFAFARQTVVARVEGYAVEEGIGEITLEVYEAGKTAGGSGFPEQLQG